MLTPQQAALIGAVQAHIDALAQTFTFDGAADLYARAAFDQSPYFPLAVRFASWADRCWTISDTQVLLNTGTLPRESDLLALMPVFYADGA